MLIVGPRSTMAPLPCSSDPTTCPYCVASDGSNVAATDTAAGICVTPVRPSPGPSGPSSSPMAGMHRLGMAEMSKTYDSLVPAPVTSLILSARVICAISICTRWETGSDLLSQGQEELEGVGVALADASVGEAPPASAAGAASAASGSASTSAADAATL